MTMIEMRWRPATVEDDSAVYIDVGRTSPETGFHTVGMVLEYRHRQYSAALPANIDHSWSQWTVVPVVTE